MGTPVYYSGKDYHAERSKAGLYRKFTTAGSLPPVAEQLQVFDGQDEGHQCTDEKSIDIARKFTQMGVGISLVGGTSEGAYVEAITRVGVRILKEDTKLVMGMDIQQALGSGLFANGFTAEDALTALADKFEKSTLMVPTKPGEYEIWACDETNGEPALLGSVTTSGRKITGFSLSSGM